jgi:hypothetical protein
MSAPRLPAGWRHQMRGFDYICRVCHHRCSNEEEAISSPRYAFYHTWCVETSPAYRRAIKHTQTEQKVNHE